MRRDSAWRAVLLVNVLMLLNPLELAAQSGPCDDCSVARPLISHSNSAAEEGGHQLLSVATSVLADPRRLPPPGWFATARSQATENLSASSPWAKAASSMAQAQPGQQRSWIGRHPVLFGTLVGFGGGFLVGMAAGGDDFANAEVYGLIVGGVGAGVGALVGAVGR